jgi:hypothetical protein
MICRHDWSCQVWGFKTRRLVLTCILCGSLVFTDKAAEDGPAMYPRLGEVGDGVVGMGGAGGCDGVGARCNGARTGPGWFAVAAARRSASGR